MADVEKNALCPLEVADSHNAITMILTNEVLL